MTDFIGKYVSAQIRFCWHEGPITEFCFCESFNRIDNKYKLFTKDGNIYYVFKDNIKFLVNIVETQKYQIGDIVEIVDDYISPILSSDINNRCGEIISVNIFANDIDYVIKLMDKNILIIINQYYLKSN